MCKCKKTNLNNKYVEKVSYSEKNSKYFAYSAGLFRLSPPFSFSPEFEVLNIAAFILREKTGLFPNKH